MKGEQRRTVAVIGDGAMTAGMAFEALNHTAHTDAELLVVLNDNNMSISHNVGGLATYFSKIWASRFYNAIREGGKKVLKTIPSAAAFVRRTEEHMKGMVAPGTLFEELGFTYFGPIDGHDLPELIHTIKNLQHLSGPILLHTITRKGQGFIPAEEDPVGYHALSKIEPVPKSEIAVSKPDRSTPASPARKYQDVFGEWLCDMAESDSRLVAITPAMCEGSGMVEFSKRFPDRYYDVAIAEQHAVTLAAGLACEGIKPVVAIYSSFLQRGYDQLIHDVALQNLNVTFGIDRAGLVGEDGATHAGSFDLSYLRCIPNMMVAAPSDENECRQLLYTAFLHDGPAAVRYPRGAGLGATVQKQMTALAPGKGVVRREGKRVAVLNFGTLLSPALQAADQINATVADMRFVKPLDEELITRLALDHDLLVTIEENSIQGGAGAAVSEYLATTSVVMPILHLGLPDAYVEHANHQQQLHAVGLSADAIQNAIEERLRLLDGRPSAVL